jgi:hypothetical protein
MRKIRSNYYSEWGNFTIIPNLVAVDLLPMMSGEALKIYVLLMGMTNRNRGDFRAWPSYETIRIRTGMSNRKVARGIKELLELGLVAKEKRFAQSNVYTIINPQSSQNERSVLSPVVEKQEETNIDNVAVVDTTALFSDLEDGFMLDDKPDVNDPPTLYLEYYQKAGISQYLINEVIEELPIDWQHSVLKTLLKNRESIGNPTGYLAGALRNSLSQYRFMIGQDCT